VGAQRAEHDAGDGEERRQLRERAAHQDGSARRRVRGGIALDTYGNLSEGSGQNVFIVRDGVIYTPPIGNSVLWGITRDSVITIAHDLGFDVREQTLPRETLYIADEVFFVGTAVEVTPIRSVDRVVIGRGRRGPVTGALQQRFFQIVKGEAPDTHGWLQFINTPAAATSGTAKGR
jgi:branched-chain amino acid aminotransferase